MRTGWKACTLGDVLTLQRGFDLPERERHPGNVPIISSSGITGYHDVAKVRAPGVVTGRYGTLGDVFYLKEDFWPLNTSLYVRDFKGNDPLFISYFLRTLNLARQNAAGAVPGVNRNALHMLAVTVPSFPIQRQIASILSAFDVLIENNARRIANLEERARLLYEEWFVRFRFPGHENVKLVESEGGMVPDGWKVMKLGEIAQELRRNISPDAVNPETPYVGLEHMPRRSIALTAWGKAQAVQSTKLVFEQGEILFGKIRPYLHKVCVAPFSGVCSSDTLVIVPKQEEYKALILCCLSSDAFVAFASKTAQGTHMPRAHWNVLAERFIALPPHHVLATFNELANRSIDIITTFLLRNTALRQARDRLLPGLISGEIDVSGWIKEEGARIVELPSRREVPLGRVAEMADKYKPEPVEREGVEWRSLWE